MPESSVSITGFPELERKLKELELVAQKAVVTNGVKAGAALIKEEAESRAPSRSGQLKKHIIVTTAGEGNTVDEVRVKIGPDKSAFYGLFQEIGTAHMTARPFLRPALENKRQQALAIMADVLKAAIDKVVRS